MNKSVLMPISPLECELIISGKKTIIVQKTKPKIPTPFKAYIYCTLPPKEEFFWHHDEMGRKTIGEYANELLKLSNGQIVYDYGMRLACEDGDYTKDNFLCQKVIGEFTCDEIKTYPYENYNDGEHFLPFGDLEKICLDGFEIYSYLGTKDGYGWHISNLKIYDKPKDLTEFHKHCNEQCEKCDYLDTTEIKSFGCIFSVPICLNLLHHSPKSWCYVYGPEDMSYNISLRGTYNE